MLEKFKRFVQVDNASVVPPPPPPPPSCVFYTITVTVPENLTFNITPCGGSATNYVLNSEGTATYNACTSSINSQPPGLGTKYTIFIGDECP